MAQVSAWIQEKIECLEGQMEELDEEIRGVEERCGQKRRRRPR